MLLSVGTGITPALGRQSRAGSESPKQLVQRFIKSGMYGSQTDQDINCRMVGRCVHGAKIDWEIGDLIPRDDEGGEIPVAKDVGRSFLYGRYNTELTQESLKYLDLDWSDKAIARLRPLDAIGEIDPLQEIGRRVAQSVDLAAFGALAR